MKLILVITAIIGVFLVAINHAETIKESRLDPKVKLANELCKQYGFNESLATVAPKGNLIKMECK